MKGLSIPLVAPLLIVLAAKMAVAETVVDGTHWAFLPVPHPSVPPEISQDAAGPLDAWHQALLEDQDLPMATPASRQTLARRLAIQLHGLPPSYADVAAFVKDESLNAHARHLDRLLASPRYGERWARHWMDVARYADNKGYVFEEERRYPYSYTYRDWLVQAFNADLPYDAFVMQQLAGDHVAEETGDRQAYAAMGFLTLGRRFLNRQPDIIDDRIDVVTRGLLGLTVSCARCHDHKFDPIPIEDYYSLYGVFASSQEPNEKPLLGDPDPTSPEYRAFIEESKERQKKIDEFFRTRHAKLRTQPVLQAYFTLAHDGRDWESSKVESRAQKEKLYQKIALRWRDRIADLCNSGNSAFLPWKKLAQGTAPLSAPEAKARLEAIREESNPVIWNALRDAGARTMEEVIAVYAREISAANHEDAHPDASKESLRQLLVGRDSPTGLAPEALYRLFNTPDQQAVRRLRRELERHQAMSPGAPPRGMVMVDRDRPVDPHVFLRGNPRSRGPKVPRQDLTILAGSDRKPFTEGSGRLELARSIANKNNPLTARVFVNRVWMHYFDEPLVASPSDFGVRTESPVLVKLLDRLAADFMRHDWSVKWLHREILQSQLYAQDSLANPAALERDPENRWLTRAPRQRLGFEAMRDSLLAVSSEVDLRMGGLPVDILSKPFSKRRSLYGFIDRQNLPGTFRTFDLASPDAHTPRRLETMVPQQALYMMNGPLVDELAITLGNRSASQATQSGKSRAITELYRRLFAREPEPEEVALGEQFIMQWQPSDAGGSSSNWQAYAHALMASNEFLFID